MEWKQNSRTENLIKILEIPYKQRRTQHIANNLQKKAKFHHTVDEMLGDQPESHKIQYEKVSVITNYLLTLPYHKAEEMVPCSSTIESLNWHGTLTDFTCKSLDLFLLLRWPRLFRLFWFSFDSLFMFISIPLDWPHQLTPRPKHLLPFDFIALIISYEKS